MITQLLHKNHRGMRWSSGRIYTFNYTNYENDPHPMIILMCAYTGKHPNTQKQWDFFQGINFSYIPRYERRQFAASWINELERRNGNAQFLWQDVLNKYTYLHDAIRRYLYKPSWFISGALEVPLEDTEEAIVSTWEKDFSNKMRNTMLKKMRDARKIDKNSNTTQVQRARRI